MISQDQYEESSINMLFFVGETAFLNQFFYSTLQTETGDFSHRFSKFGFLIAVVIATEHYKGF